MFWTNVIPALTSLDVGSSVCRRRTVLNHVCQDVARTEENETFGARVCNVVTLLPELPLHSGASWTDGTTPLGLGNRIHTVCGPRRALTQRLKSTAGITSPRPGKPTMQTRQGARPTKHRHTQKKINTLKASCGISVLLPL